MTRVSAILDAHGRPMARSGSYEVLQRSRTRRLQDLAGGAADDHHDPSTLWGLREISRNHDRNGCLLHGVFSRAVDTSIGPTGIGYNPKSKNARFNTLAEAYLAERFGPSLDTRGLLDLTEIQRVALRSVWRDGDCVAAWREDTGGGYSLRLIESDELVTPSRIGGKTTAKIDRRGKRTGRGPLVVQGVEFNEDGRAVAYWRGPRSAMGTVSSDDDAQRIPAYAAHYLPNIRRAGQTRGEPVLAAALGTYDRLDAFVDNEALAAEINSRPTLVIQRNNSDFWGEIFADAAETYDPKKAAEAMASPLPRGGIIDLAVGEEFKGFDPQRPAGTFGPFVNSVMTMIGASVGFPLVLLLLDFSKVNYSSARAAILAAAMTCRRWQEYMIRRLLWPVYVRTISQGIADGDLPATRDAYRVSWYPRTWGWLDIYKETVANERAILSGQKTLTQILAEQGRTLDEYIEERGDELDKLKAAGIPTSAVPEPVNERWLDGEEPPAQEDAA